ncbi:MAG: hypothetical protein AAFR26_26620 [Cyanobacteria bacterium J06626_4]
MRILAVDEDPGCRDLTATILKEYQAEVLIVGSAQEALAQLPLTTRQPYGRW